MEEQKFFIAKATIKVAFASLFLYVFWYLREYAISDRFGISAALDAFLVAQSGPFFIGTVLMVCLQTVLVPIYLEAHQKGGMNGAARFRDSLLSWLLVFLLAVMAGLILFSYPLINWIGAGLSFELRALSLQLYFIQVPLVFFCGVFGFASAIMIAEKRYIVVTILPIISSFVPAVMTWFFYKSMGVYSLAWGFLLGWGFQCLIAIGIIYFQKPSFHLTLAFDARIKEVVNLSFPIALGLMGTGLIPLIDRNAASFLPAGSIAALGYAERVFQLLVGLFASFQTVVFPLYSEQVILNQFEELSKSVRDLILFVIWLCFPITILLWTQALPITQLLFMRGEFNQAAVNTTAQLIAVYGFALIFTNLGNIFVKVLNAYKDSISVGFLGLLNPVLKMMGNTIFIPAWGLMAFPLAYLGMSLVVMVLLVLRIRQKLAIHYDWGFWFSIVKVALAAGISVAVFWLIESLSAGIIHSSWVLISTMMVVAYIFSCWLLNVELFREIILRIKQRWLLSNT